MLQVPWACSFGPAVALARGLGPLCACGLQAGEKTREKERKELRVTRHCFVCFIFSAFFSPACFISGQK